jgi:hypothetical protein
VVQVATARTRGGRRTFPKAIPLSQRFQDSVNPLVGQYPRWSRRYGRWALLATIAALADGKLLLAGAAGFGVYQWATAAPHLSLSWATVQSVVQRCQQVCNGPLVKPLALGSSAFGLTYLTALLWHDLGTLPTLVLLGFGAVNSLTLWLLWQNRDGLLRPVFDHRLFEPELRAPARVQSTRQPLHTSAETLDTIAPTEAQWQHLSSSDALRRLVAVRALTQWSLHHPDGDAAYLPGSQVSVRSHLVDCYQLMLAQEPEPAVRAALRESIDILKPKPQLGPGQPALNPLERRSAPITIPQRRVEYLEP